MTKLMVLYENFSIRSLLLLLICFIVVFKFCLDIDKKSFQNLNPS